VDQHVGQRFTLQRDHQRSEPHAAACYAAEHDLMWKIWDLAGGISNPDAYRAMTDPAVRSAMADIIRQAREQDAIAADHIEQALA